MAAIIRFDLDVSEITNISEDGCCTTAVVQNKIEIHQQTGDRLTFICNNFYTEQALSISVLSCSI